MKITITIVFFTSAVVVTYLVLSKRRSLRLDCEVARRFCLDSWVDSVGGFQCSKHRTGGVSGEHRSASVNQIHNKIHKVITNELKQQNVMLLPNSICHTRSNYKHDIGILINRAKIYIV